VSLGPLLREPFVVTVSDPGGPRASAPRPPFAFAVPIVSSTVVRIEVDGSRSRAVRLRLDCSAHPEAAELLADRTGPGLHVSIAMRTHRTGNGYVALGVTAADGPPEDSGVTQAGIVLALDPVTHAPILDALVDIGRAMLADDSAGGGLLIPVEPPQVVRARAAALAHPRQVRVSLRVR
jgi:hypothetical protein